jgi:hypothetical protein
LTKQTGGSRRAGEASVNRGEDDTLEADEVGGSSATDALAVSVSAERVAMWHGGDENGGDDGQVHGRENVVKVGSRAQI